MRISVVRRVVLPVAVFVLLLPGSALAQQYHRTDLTADSSAASATAPNLDTNLVNAWGLSRASGSPWWVSDNGTGLSTLYNATGMPQALVVTIPTPDGTGTSAPTAAAISRTAMASSAGPTTERNSQPGSKGANEGDTVTTGDGTKIYFKDWGSGPTAVFSHGWPLNADAWDAQMMFLAERGYRVIAHDWRGHADQASPGTATIWTPMRMIWLR